MRTPGEIDGFWRRYLATASDHARGNEVPDAHLIALLRQHDVTIYTRDRDFLPYEGVDVRDPFG